MCSYPLSGLILAARKTGSFHEYWTWEKYAGKTEPGGAPWYGETSAGFLDVLLHGTWGISSPQPGFKSLRLAPHFPKTWKSAQLELCLPNGARMAIQYRNDATGTLLRVKTEGGLPAEVILPWFGPGEPIVEGAGLINPRTERDGSTWRGAGQLRGEGELRLKARPG